jgi:hypothetical protein
MTTTIVTRASKGGRLSFTDMDNNLLNLKTTADAAAPQIITYTKLEVDTAIGIETTRAIATETLKAPLTSPTFTGTVSGIDKVMVGLGNVDNTTDLLKPISTATQTALDLKAVQSTTYTKTETDTRIQSIVGAAPIALDTLVEIAAQLASDESAAAALVTTVSTKVDKVAGKGLSTEDYTTIEKTKLSTISGSNTGDQVIPTALPASDVSPWAKATTKPNYTATEVGLGNLDNTTDLLKPISTATQTALNLKSNIITVSDDTTSNATRYLYFGGSTTGNVTAVSTSSTNLQYNPSSGTVSATNFSSTSDKTLKNNIKTISNSEEIISKINPVEFTWKKTGTKSYGVIAQELEDILPELIHTNNEGVKSVEYSALIGFLLASNKELLTRVSVLEMK